MITQPVFIITVIKVV